MEAAERLQTLRSTAIILMFAGLAFLVHLAWKRNGPGARPVRGQATLGKEAVR